MRNLMIMIAFFITTSLSYADTQCFDFVLNKYATELTKVRFSLFEKTEKKSFKAEVTGTTGDKSITTPFVCMAKKDQVSCSQEDGGGDFTLATDGLPTLTFSYINLAIGAMGPYAAKPGVELDEEFAFLNTTASDNDDEEEAGHITEVSINGNTMPCESKF